MAKKATKNAVEESRKTTKNAVETYDVNKIISRLSFLNPNFVF